MTKQNAGAFADSSAKCVDRSVPPSDPPRRRVHVIAFLVMVGMNVMMSVACIRSTPVLIDEYGHIPAGVSHWQLGRFFVYRENPPVVRLLTSLPVLASHPVVNYSSLVVGHRTEFNVGVDFMSANAEVYQSLVERARCMELLLSIACGALIFWWTSQAHGGRVALVCSSLWFFDPTVLAHGSLATVDVGASTFACLAVYLFRRFAKDPGWSSCLVAGVGLGLAQGSKFTLLVLYPSYLFLMILIRSHFLLFHQWPSRRATWPQLFLILAVGLFTLNAIYGFDGTFTPLGSFSFKSKLLSGVDVRTPEESPAGNRFRNSAFHSIPVPFPRDYVLGFDSQKSEEESGFYRRDRGRLVHRGRWTSPAEIIALKWPVGTILLSGVALLYAGLHPKSFRGEGLFPLVPAVMILALLSLQTGLNWVVRYGLPAWPLLFVALGGPVRAACHHRRVRHFVLLCVIVNMLTCISCFPHFLSFGNLFAGGRDGALEKFIGSNLDWGQDFFRLVEWKETHAGNRPIIATYYGIPEPHHSGFATRVPCEFWESNFHRSASLGPRESFYWAISASILNGIPAHIDLDNGLSVTATVDSPLLRPENAAACAGSTIFIFKIVPSTSNETGKVLRFDDLKGCLAKTPVNRRGVIPNSP